jgi:hypothetical protein
MEPSCKQEDEKVKLQNLEVKTLITLLTIAAILGGYYYTTQDRLNHLEEDVTQLQKQVKRVNRVNKK